MIVVVLANDTTYTYNLRKEIIQRLIKDGNQVYIIAEIHSFKKELENMGCKIVNISIGRHRTNPFSDIVLMFTYLRLIKKIKPNAVISYNIKPNSYGGMACKLLNITFYPNITGLGTPIETPSKIQKLATTIYKIGVSSADCIFFQNQSNLEFFEDHHMISRTTRAHLLPGSGVNLETYPLLPYPGENKTIHFLFVARIMKEKGIDYFLTTAKKITSERQDCVFDVCGSCDDDKYERILKEAQDEGYIRYHGQQKNMEEWYLKCNCVIFPSYYPEGMSNVLLEAAASGRPLIVTDRAGCREIVTEGKTGFIVPAKNEKAVIDATEKFLKLPWKKKRQMGIEGRKKIETQFDRNIVVDSYISELYK